MCKRRRHILLLALPPLFAALALAVWLLRPDSAITLENVDRIELGMNLQEVEAILGGPARDESTGPLTSDRSEALAAYDRRDRPKWQSDTAVIWLSLDNDGNVCGVSRVRVWRVEQGPLDMLRRWLRL
jgi:hypothetical protein